MLRKTRTNYNPKPKEKPINPKVLEEIKAFEQNVDPQSVPRVTICGCGHEKESHYGGEKGYCNSKDCPCLEFK